MEHKIEINRLSREDLEYELALRGSTPKPSVSEMRSLVRYYKRMGPSSSFVMPPYPYTFRQDSEAISNKLTSLEKTISDFAGTRQASEYKKTTTALAFVYERINNSKPESEPEIKTRTEFVRKALELSSKLVAKAKAAGRAAAKAQSSLLELGPPKGSSSVAGSEEEDEDDGDLSPPVKQGASTVTTALPVIKPVPVSAWGIKFAGHTRDMSVGAFLERVSELKLSRNSTDQIIFNSAIDLFSGSALIWYRANRDTYSTWSELAEGLRLEFQSSDYDERLFEEIKRRTQGNNETMGLYVSVMKNLFSRLSVSVSEDTQLRILLKNILPFYQTQLGLTEITSIADLLKCGKLLEARRASVEAYVPPPLRGKSLEPDLAYVGVHPTTSQPSVRVSTVTPPTNSVVCWNCKRPGHRFMRCPEPRQRFCYRCGKPGVVVSSCSKCSGNGSRVR